MMKEPLKIKNKFTTKTSKLNMNVKYFTKLKVDSNKLQQSQTLLQAPIEYPRTHLN